MGTLTAVLVAAPWRSLQPSLARGFGGTRWVSDGEGEVDVIDAGLTTVLVPADVPNSLWLTDLLLDAKRLVELSALADVHVLGAGLQSTVDAAMLVIAQSGTLIRQFEGSPEGIDTDYGELADWDAALRSAPCGTIEEMLEGRLEGEVRGRLRLEALVADAPEKVHVYPDRLLCQTRGRVIPIMRPDVRSWFWNPMSGDFIYLDLADGKRLFVPRDTDHTQMRGFIRPPED